MNYWLVKQEPDEFSWDDLVRTGRVTWDGVRNYAARNHLSAMQVGDRVLFYHSVTGKCVMGIAEVLEAAFPDPTDDTGKWVSVVLKPLQALNRPVSLSEIKTSPELQNLALIRQSRLSVMPVQLIEFQHILTMGETSLME